MYQLPTKSIPQWDGRVEENVAEDTRPNPGQLSKAAPHPNKKRQAKSHNGVMLQVNNGDFFYPQFPSLRFYSAPSGSSAVKTPEENARFASLAVMPMKTNYRRG